jgi:dihydropteroate synthase
LKESVGGDAALNRSGLDCSASETGAILMGTQKQFQKLLLKLDQNTDLQPLSESLKDTLKNIAKTHFAIRCRQKKYVLGKRTLLMGILNITPDSFSDGGIDPAGFKTPSLGGGASSCDPSD